MSAPARSQALFVWAFSSALAVIVALAAKSAAFAGGHYIPVGNDAFYHARRILDLIADPSNLHEFDKLIHYPEGSLLIWPWGYDYLMSLLVRLGLMLHLGANAIDVLVYIPVVAFPACIALVVLICRQLGLSLGATLAAALATVFFPLNQSIYSIGNVDHHFAEQIILLSSLACGLAWLAKPESTVRACGLGVLMGAALCIHNGLFIIQVPIGLLFVVSWLRGRRLPRNTWTFSIALVIGTVLAAAPSTAFREGAFEFYELSWFHIYFSACVGVTCWFVSRLQRSPRTLLVLAAMILAMLTPVGRQFLLAGRFLSVHVEGAEYIAETQSVWGLAASRRSLTVVTNLYSFLVLLAPFAVAFAAFRAWKSETLERGLFWVTCLLGLAMLAIMVRMHVFGSVALSLVWIVLLDEMVAKGRLTPSLVKPAWGLLVLAACGPAIPALLAPRVASNDPYYALTYDIYPDLQRECAKAPGVALSNLDDANYVRYHTDCAIIANNFLLTAFHESKVQQARSLFATPASDLPARAPFVRYVLVHRQSLWAIDPEDGTTKFWPGGNPRLPDPPLVAELIDVAPTDLPPRFHLVKELAFERPTHSVFARLFAIDPPAAGDSARIASPAGQSDPQP